MAQVVQLSPSLVVQRNAIKPYANMNLAQNHAFNVGERMAVWRALDISAKGRPLSEEALQWLEHLKPQLTGDMATWQIFYRGMRYTFNDTQHPGHLDQQRDVPGGAPHPAPGHHRAPGRAVPRPPQ